MQHITLLLLLLLLLLVLLLLSSLLLFVFAHAPLVALCVDYVIVDPARARGVEDVLERPFARALYTLRRIGELLQRGQEELEGHEAAAREVHALLEHVPVHGHERRQDHLKVQLEL